MNGSFLFYSTLFSLGTLIWLLTTLNIAHAIPLAQDDSYILLEDTSLVVPASGVLGNDTNGLTATLVLPPSHGTVALTANGAFTYTPALNFSGTDQFVYAASDGTASAEATVYLTVTAVNDAPVTGLQSFLYDTSQNNLPDDQTFDLLVNPFNPLNAPPQQVADGVLFTTAVDEQAGYTQIVDPPLNRADGFSIRFGLQLNSETHSSPHRAGFSVVVVTSDAKAIELGFWEDQIWAQEDGESYPPSGTLFTQAESRPFTTTHGFFELIVYGDSYTLLQENNSQVLHGALRDYSAFSGLFDVYETPNFLFLGDDTTSAGASVVLEDVAIVHGKRPFPTTASPNPLPTFGLFDIDAQQHPLTAHFAPTYGTITATTNSYVSHISTQTNTLTITASQTSLNNAFLFETWPTYQPLADFGGTDVTTLTLYDHGWTGGTTLSQTTHFTITVSGQLTPALTITPQAANAQLYWNIHSQNCQYDLYHSNTPYTGYTQLAQNTYRPYSHPAVIGVGNTADFYQIRATTCTDMPPLVSNNVGVFDYALVAGTP